MKKALIFGNQIAQVVPADAEFPVAATLTWRDVPDEVTTEWTWDGTQAVAHPVPTLDENRAVMVEQIIAEGLRRIAQQVPALSNLNMVGFMAELWPALDTAALGAPMLAAKDVYVYAKGKIAWAQTATQVELDAYDPATDPGWPA